MPGISDFLRRIVASELHGEADAELLGRFLTKRDEAAFAALVRRHGAMVYHVCRGVLRNEADAEDATQATFLVLAQKAAQVRKRNSLSSWLHGVALRTSRKLQASIARRRAVEVQVPPPPSATPDDWSVREARMLLHEEVERLPARYKDPLVLCYLRGKTHDEAAAELGWTITLRQVTHENSHVSLYGWSPDGRKLLYNFTRRSAQPKAGAAYHQILAVIDTNGINRIKIIDNAAHFNDQGQMRMEDLIGWADWR